MPEARTIWKAVTISGFGITLAGAIALGLSLSGVELLDRLGDSVFLPALVGVLVLVIGLIGWASQLDRHARARMAGLALLPPGLLVITTVFGNPNIHGIFPLFLFTCIPLFFAGIILGIMALASRRP